MARSKVTDVPMALAVKIELFKRGVSTSSP